MRKRDEWITRIKLVEQEWEIATVAVARLADEARSDLTLLPPNSKFQDVRRTAEALPTTYFVRLFAVFEAGLRQYWRDGLSRPTQPQARDLLDGMTSARGIDNPVHEAAHRVREFRNALVHEQEGEPGEAFTVAEARRHLTRFFSYLPPDW
jgi:hypothetical protein